MATSFSVVPYSFRELIQEQLDKQTQGKIFFFDANDEVNSCEGRILKMEEVPGRGLMITMTNKLELPADRIITLFGKPGAAFDEYDAYANQCLACTGGYDL